MGVSRFEEGFVGGHGVGLAGKKEVFEGLVSCANGEEAGRRYVKLERWAEDDRSGSVSGRNGKRDEVRTG